MLFNRAKTIGAALMVGVLLLIPFNSRAVHTLTDPPPQLVDAITGSVPNHPVNITFFTVTPQEDGTVIAAFIVQGVGKWDLVEICHGATSRVLASGVDSPNGDILNVVVLPADGQYEACILECWNMHGFPSIFSPE
jgi:hypothetical protein